MTDLADFLRARIAERRAIAEAAAADAEEDWSPGDEHLSSSVNEATSGAAVVIGPWEYLDWDVRRHIAANDPAHVLADLDAKLAIVNRHTACGTGNGYCDDGGHGWDDLQGGGCADLADLARPFAGHPDYKEDWAA